MSKLIEEMGELNQVLGKLIGTDGQAEHWDGTDLRQRAHEEVADLFAALAFFCHVNDFDPDFIAERGEAKIALFEKWHAEQGGAPLKPG